MSYQADKPVIDTRTNMWYKDGHKDRHRQVNDNTHRPKQALGKNVNFALKTEVPHPIMALNQSMALIGFKIWHQFQM